MSRAPRPQGGWLDTTSTQMLSLPFAQAVVRRLARSRRLVLLYHRVVAHSEASISVVPTITVDEFAAQLDVISRMARIVPLGEPLENGPTVSVTFDDDASEHAGPLLDLLVEREIEATFFLSGRWLHGRGPYWWEILEAHLNTDGLAVVAGRLAAALDKADAQLASRIAAAHDPATLAGRIAGTVAVEAITDGACGTVPIDRKPMDSRDAARLSAAGMTVGFHTLDHHVLTRLNDDELARALTQGRDDLAKAVESFVPMLAYPHGRAGRREAAAAAAAGFSAAYTTAQRPVGARTNPMLRGRWEPVGWSPSQLGPAMRQRLVRRAIGVERDW